MNYADSADEASAREQHMIEVALASRKPSTITFTGFCHWCEDTIDKGHYCSPECREDDEKDKRAKQQRRLQ